MAQKTYTPRKLTLEIRDALQRDRLVTTIDQTVTDQAGTGRVIGARVRKGQFEVRMLTGRWYSAGVDRAKFNLW